MPTCRLVLESEDLPAVSPAEGRCQAVLAALMLLVADGVAERLLVGTAPLLLPCRPPPELCSRAGKKVWPCRVCAFMWSKPGGFSCCSAGKQSSAILPDTFIGQPQNVVLMSAEG